MTGAEREQALPGLDGEEVRHFHERGYVGPFTLCSPDEMAVIRDEIVGSVLAGPGPFRSPVEQSRHLDRRVVYDLCAHPEVVGRMASVYGDDLVLWRSHFFVKERGAKEIPWHQDANYWPIEPPLNISAWIAIDESTLENSCLQVIPGSHRTVLPHVPAAEDMAFVEMADPSLVDDDACVSLEMRAGQFVLFNERTLHHSAPNVSDRRRIGLAVRVTVPFVRVDELFEGHGVVVIAGTDRFGFNRLLEPPPA